MEELNLIPSFQVNHEILDYGVYVSRKDKVGSEIITTFDVRMKLPNREPVIDNPSLHAMEHLGATYLRNHEMWKNETIYFGPMWCRTGFYVIFKWDLEPKDVIDVLTWMFNFMADFEWEIPWADPKECGNFLDLNLTMAIHEARLYLEQIQKFTERNFVYAS